MYFLDNNLLSVDRTVATYIGKGTRDSALFLVDCFDKNTEKLMLSVHFQDSLLSNLEGIYKEYFVTGKIKQEGNYLKGEQHGEWSVWDSTGLQILSILYNNGKLISLTEFSYYKGRLSNKIVKDSIGEEKMLTRYDEKGNIFNDDTIFERVDVKPIFPGNSTFQEYLIQDLRKDIPYLRGAPNGRYLAVINFVVDAKGNITNVKYESLNGYGMEDEAIRVIKNSPLWIPAMKNGNSVSYRMKEIVPFAVRR